MRITCIVRITCVMRITCITLSHVNYECTFKYLQNTRYDVIRTHIVLI